MRREGEEGGGDDKTLDERARERERRERDERRDERREAVVGWETMTSIARGRITQERKRWRKDHPHVRKQTNPKPREKRKRRDLCAKH